MPARAVSVDRARRSAVRAGATRKRALVGTSRIAASLACAGGSTPERPSDEALVAAATAQMPGAFPSTSNIPVTGSLRGPREGEWAIGERVPNEGAREESSGVVFRHEGGAWKVVTHGTGDLCPDLPPEGRAARACPGG